MTCELGKMVWVTWVEIQGLEYLYQKDGMMYASFVSCGYGKIRYQKIPINSETPIFSDHSWIFSKDQYVWDGQKVCLSLLMKLRMLPLIRP